MKNTKIIFIVALIACLWKCKDSMEVNIRDVWTVEQANTCYQQQGWLRGCNFIPGTAINQLEMWQAETFDTATIKLSHRINGLFYGICTMSLGIRDMRTVL
jgi:hypothetical protein